MPDSHTPNFNLIEPEVGSSRDTWGSKTNSNWDAVDAIMAALLPIGAVLDFAGGSAPAGFLLCDGTSYPISTYPKLAAVLGSTYGGDGTTTFAVPDCRGRVTAGVGTTTDQDGNTTGVTLGQKLGYWWKILTAAQMPNYALSVTGTGQHQHTGATDGQGLHAHNGSTDAQGNHAHTFSAVGSTPGAFLAGAGVVAANLGSLGTSTAGNHAHNITTTTDGFHSHNVTTYAGQGDHTHTVMLGGSSAAVPLYQPTIGLNRIIFAGPPGFTTLSAPIVGAPALMASPMRGPG